MNITKKLLGTMAALVLAVTTFAQVTVSGIVTGKNNQPLHGATVTLRINGKQERTVLTNIAGSFGFTGIAPQTACILTVQYVGLQTMEEHFTASEKRQFTFVLPDQAFLLEPLEVKAIRASEKAPFTKTNISKSEIAKLNQGQDIPFLLDKTPSVVVNSDAGNGVGYTGIRIRGTDATRINVTLNGIPYNDAESQGSFFVDLPDFASSVNSIQVQRGVGTSTNGSGAFGATINMSTNEFNEQPYAASNNSFGAFNTWKNTIRVGSGLLGKHFTLDARLSRVSSDGFIDRATSNLQSFYFSPAYTSKKTSIRLNVFSGKEKTYQAWYGVPEAKLRGDMAGITEHYYNNIGYLYFTPADSANLFGSDNRKFNLYNYKNQTDNYQQDHYQLFLNQVLNPDWSLNIASFLTRGKGYYEEYKSAESFEDYGLQNPVFGNDTTTTTDLVRDRWLDNYFYGQVFSLQYKNAANELTIGGSWTKYDGKHYGDIIWSTVGIPKDYRYYNLTAYKLDVNVYAKWLHQLNTNWNIFGDLQYRTVRHEMNGFKDNPDLYINRSFHFFNPKAGVSYFNNGYHAYASYALAHREPNRDDFEASPSEQPQYETLHDVEVGIDRKKGMYNWGATFYYMYYNNQLVLTGKINDVGSYTRTNVPNSYRLGLELQGGITITNWLNAAANISLSRNKIKAFTAYVDDWDNGKQQSFSYNNTDISFSPAITGGGNLTFTPLPHTELSLFGKYVSRQYMDNTQNKNRSLGGYFVQDIRAVYTLKDVWFKEWNFIFQLNNVLNRRYEPNGYTYAYFYGGAVRNDNYYYPMAGINYMLSVNIGL